MVKWTRGRLAKYTVTVVCCAVTVLLTAFPTLLGGSNAYLQVFSVVDFSPPKDHDASPVTHNSRPIFSLEKHTYTSDGLLIVNPNGPHPIFELMQNAEASWNSKLARASKTLAEAVIEYKQRYKRAPPLGFDKWWEYAVEHNVQLPDEYDEIYHDLEPYWGLDPVDLARSVEELGTQDDIFTVVKTLSNFGLEIANLTVHESNRTLRERIEAIINLTEEFGADLPPMRIQLSARDNPRMHTDWRIRDMALSAARHGTTIQQSHLLPVTKDGWIQACPPNSPARLDPPVLPSVDSNPVLSNMSASKSFIVSHRAAMHPCYHPEILVSHGQFLSHRRGPLPQQMLVPLFSHCGTLLHHDIRPPIPYGWTSGDHSEVLGDVPWSEKADERLDWRGSPTGMYASPETLWIHAHRQRLVTLTNEIEGSTSVLRVPSDASSPVGEPLQLRMGRINPAWMDIAFSGKPMACEEDAGTCKLMEEMFEFRKMQGRKEEGRYKFILDVDGNGWSGRFKRLVTSNALILKVSVYPEWYTSRIAEWVHYVPIQVTYTDLYDVVAFFRDHDELAAKIAGAGKEWSQQYWRKEDMSAYLYRLLLEYARVMSVDRESMSYHG
ncbi:glycosyl transferase family 90-domain-containing protein [Pisolithus orientalis]|uniref:glycosyl transferase family 90-domain-containing protein n=1 Tax=Pisolithus orientalis TaxID=936130 RepID=UPI00222570B1|nr:glycosyl transferase family 90-domain-containing protein [Pisolithus orientalis]KAI5988277.1 glycosyl transferase family 90-domain-containing protein [Pisolithus orientalis]